jgi:hypothetical protein
LGSGLVSHTDSISTWAASAVGRSTNAVSDTSCAVGAPRLLDIRIHTHTYTHAVGGSWWWWWQGGCAGGHLAQCALVGVCDDGLLPRLC